MEATLEQSRPKLERPSILDEIMGDIDEGTRKDELVKAKRQVENNLMEKLGNIRLQEDMLRQKEAVYEALPDETDHEELVRRERSIDMTRELLEELYQGGVALSNELRRIKAALEDMKDAGLAAFKGNRAGRRSATKR